MSEFFGRVVEVIVDNLKINNDFDIEFDVEFDDGPDVNVSTVTIYNLTDKTIRHFTKGKRIVLNAGYIGDIGTILTGKIQASPKTVWENPDKKTTITIADVNDNWLTKNIKKTYKADVTAKTILADVLKMANVGIGKISLPTNKVYKGGKSISGTVGQVIAEIAPDCNAKWHQDGGKIYISGKNEGMETNVLLNKNSGLLETPTPYSKTETYKVNKTVVSYQTVNGKKTKKVSTEEVDKERTLNGYKVKCLLNHRITTDSIIKIQSLSANGRFRVAAGTHSGDEFVTELEVYAV